MYVFYPCGFRQSSCLLGPAIKDISLSCIRQIYFQDLRGGLNCSSVFVRPLSSARASFCLAITSSCLSPRHRSPRACNSPVMRFCRENQITGKKD